MAWGIPIYVSRSVQTEPWDGGELIGCVKTESQGVSKKGEPDSNAEQPTEDKKQENRKVSAVGDGGDIVTPRVDDGDKNGTLTVKDQTDRQK